VHFVTAVTGRHGHGPPPHRSPALQYCASLPGKTASFQFPRSEFKGSRDHTPRPILTHICLARNRTRIVSNVQESRQAAAVWFAPRQLEHAASRRVAARQQRRRRRAERPRNVPGPQIICSGGRCAPATRSFSASAQIRHKRHTELRGPIRGVQTGDSWTGTRSLIGARSLATLIPT
jgi:hypothetical protein